MSETVRAIHHWRCRGCGGLASTPADEDVCECGPCGREMAPLAVVQPDDSIDMEQLAGEMLTALGPYWHQQDSMSPVEAITKVLAERDRSIRALAWAVDWIERIAEVPVPGTDEQEDWERFAAAQEILRTDATNQKEVGG